MRWLRPGEERLVRRMKSGPGVFEKRDLPALNRLIKRGIVLEQNIVCPNCGLHYVPAVRFTERGKIACMILDVLTQSPTDLLA